MQMLVINVRFVEKKHRFIVMKDGITMMKNCYKN